MYYWQDSLIHFLEFSFSTKFASSVITRGFFFLWRVSGTRPKGCWGGLGSDQKDALWWFKIWGSSCK